MTSSAKHEAKRQALTSADEVRHFVGTVSDHTIVEILSLQPTKEDIEIAVISAEGPGEILDEEGRSLEGTAARIYELLMADETFGFDEL